jgi:dTDP-4-amino-4,6-dideoxygalactose transaminase
MRSPIIEKPIQDFAIFGGPPQFEQPLHVGKPNIANRRRFLEHINDILDRRWFTNDGVYVQEFEHRVASLVGVKHCVAMCNGTVALEIATRAAGMTGEVIVPSFTFVATAHALQWQQITPIFCDIDPLTYNIDPCKIERMITPRTTGIIGVHLWGRPCAVDTLAEIADRRKLILMFDAAHALGCSYKGRMIGGFGLAEVFSFHATKFLNSFEGGGVTTNDGALAAKMRLMKNFGFAGYDNVIYIGTNGKMTEVCAAMGLTNLESLDELVAANRRNYHAYRQGLAGIRGVSLIEYDESERCNFQYIALTVHEQEAGLTRDELIQVFHAENVLARRYFYPGAHRMEPYKSYFPHAGLLLPHTDRLASRVMLLPTGTAVDPQQIATVCSILRTALENADFVRQRLSLSPPQVPPAEST